MFELFFFFASVFRVPLCMLHTRTVVGVSKQVAAALSETNACLRGSSGSWLQRIARRCWLREGIQHVQMCCW